MTDAAADADSFNSHAETAVPEQPLMPEPKPTNIELALGCKRQTAPQKTARLSRVVMLLMKPFPFADETRLLSLSLSLSPLAARNFLGTNYAAQEYRAMKWAMDPSDFSAQKILCQIDGEHGYIVRPANVAPLEDNWATIHKGAADPPTFVDLASISGSMSASSHVASSAGAPETSGRTASAAEMKSKKAKVAKPKR